MTSFKEISEELPNITNNDEFTKQLIQSIIKNNLIKSICYSFTDSSMMISPLSECIKGLMMCIGSISILSPRDVVNNYIESSKKIPDHEQFHELLTKEFSNIQHQFNHAKLSLFGHILTIVTKPGKNKIIDGFRSKIHATHIWQVQSFEET
ncbi:unnamed protein product [Cunninghamella blakesleeana]